MGGSEAMKDGSSCASFLRRPTTVSAALTAAILPARIVTRAGRALVGSSGCGSPTIEKTEEAVGIFQNGVKRVVSQLILVVLVSISRPSSRAAHAQHNPNAFLGLKENLADTCQERSSTSNLCASLRTCLVFSVWTAWHGLVKFKMSEILIKRLRHWLNVPIRAEGARKIYECLC